MTGLACRGWLWFRGKSLIPQKMPTFQLISGQDHHPALTFLLGSNALLLNRPTARSALPQMTCGIARIERIAGSNACKRLFRRPYK
jgi:hypothetical protein